MSKLQANQQLTVEAWDRDDKNKLAIGTLLTIDNQIDATTGTVKLKAEGLRHPRQGHPRSCHLE